MTKQKAKRPTLHPLAERLLPLLARGEGELASIATNLERVPKEDVAWAVTSLLAVATALPAAAPLLVRACATQSGRLQQSIDTHQYQRESMTRDAQEKLRRFQQDCLPKPKLVPATGGRSLGQLAQERGVQSVRAMAVSRASWVR